MAAKEMFDYLPDATADYDYTLTEVPFVELPFTGKKAQIIHKKDDGSVRAYTVSSQSYFDVVLDYGKISQSGHGVIFDLWNDPEKCCGSERTFYLQHPVDGHTYVARFMGEIESSYVAGYGNRRIPIKAVALRIEGRKAEA